VILHNSSISGKRKLREGRKRFAQRMHRFSTTHSARTQARNSRWNPVFIRIFHFARGVPENSRAAEL